MIKFYIMQSFYNKIDWFYNSKFGVMLLFISRLCIFCLSIGLLFKFHTNLSKVIYFDIAAITASIWGFLSAVRRAKIISEAK